MIYTNPKQVKISDKLSNSTRLIEQLKKFQRSDPLNKKCADCGECGPTFICMNFGTFICTTCSGLHRELSHRVKGVTLSEWTEDEVEFVLNHGNTEALKYLSNYDSFVSEYTGGNDIEKIRYFIHQKYIEKKWLSMDMSKKKKTLEGRIHSNKDIKKKSPDRIERHHKEDFKKSNYVDSKSCEIVNLIDFNDSLPNDNEIYIKSAAEITLPTVNPQCEYSSFDLNSLSFADSFSFNNLNETSSIITPGDEKKEPLYTTSQPAQMAQFISKAEAPLDSNFITPNLLYNGIETDPFSHISPCSENRWVDLMPEEKKKMSPISYEDVDTLADKLNVLNMGGFTPSDKNISDKSSDCLLLESFNFSKQDNTELVNLFEPSKPIIGNKNSVGTGTNLSSFESTSLLNKNMTTEFPRLENTVNLDKPVFKTNFNSSFNNTNSILPDASKKLNTLSNNQSVSNTSESLIPTMTHTPVSKEKILWADFDSPPAFISADMTSKYIDNAFHIDPSKNIFN